MKSNILPNSAESNCFIIEPLILNLNIYFIVIEYRMYNNMFTKERQKGLKTSSYNIRSHLYVCYKCIQNIYNSQPWEHTLFNKINKEHTYTYIRQVGIQFYEYRKQKKEKTDEQKCGKKRTERNSTSSRRVQQAVEKKARTQTRL